MYTTLCRCSIFILFKEDTGKRCPHSYYEGKSPIHFAAGEGSADIICILVNLAADIESVDDFGRTPLYYAAGFGHVCAISLSYVPN